MLIESLKTLWITLQTRIDALWGYDVFIAHRRTDGARYARSLFKALRGAGVAGFIDQVVYGPGDSLLISTRRHARKSSLLVVIGSPELLPVREPVDWVLEEITAYLTSHAHDPKVLVITFGVPILDALQDPHALPELLQPLQHFYRISEPREALHKRPTIDVVKAILWQLKARRRDKSRLRFFQGIAACLTALLIALGTILSAEIQQRTHAEQRRGQLEAAEARRLAPSQLGAALRQSVNAYRIDASDDARAALLDGLDRAAHIIGFYPCEIGFSPEAAAFSNEAEPAVAYSCIDVGNNTSVVTLVAHDGKVRSWHVRWDVKSLVFLGPRSLAMDGTSALRVLDTQTGHLSEFAAGEDTRLNSISLLRYAALPGNDVLLTVQGDDRIRIWHHSHGASPDSSWTPGDPLTVPTIIGDVDYNPTSNAMEIVEYDGTSYELTLASGDEVLRKVDGQTSLAPAIEDTRCPQYPLYPIGSLGHQRRPSHSADGRTRAYVTEENAVVVEQGENALCTVLHGNTRYEQIAVSTDGQRIAASGAYLNDGVGVILWDLRRLHPLAEVIWSETSLPQGRISKVAVSYDGSSWALVLPEGRVVWNGRSVDTNNDPSRYVTAAALTPHGTQLALGFSDGRVAEFSTWSDSLDPTARAPTPIHNLGSVDLSAFLIESVWYANYEVYAVDSKEHVWKVSVESFFPSVPLPGRPALYRCPDLAQFGADLSLSETNGMQSGFQLPLESGSCQALVYSAAAQVGIRATPGELSGPVLSADGATLAVIFSPGAFAAENKIALFDINSARLVGLLSAPGAYALAISGDGKKLLSYNEGIGVVSWDLDPAHWARIAADLAGPDPRGLQ